MVATTSGTTTFTLDVDDIIEQAQEVIGGEWESGAEMSKARRALNLILIELQNKNIPLNKIETSTINVTQGTRTYDLDQAIVDVLELNVSDTDTNDLEIPLERWSRREYHQIPNKDIEQRPTLWSTDRNEDLVRLLVWPTPNQTYEITMLVSKRVEDITASYERINLSYRYLPLVVAWLSYELSLLRPTISSERIAFLKARRDEIMVDAFDEDRERTDFTIKLGGISGKR